MTSSSVLYALCIVLCICSFQTVVQAKKEKIRLTVYTHETRGGPMATLLPAAGTGQGNFSALGWGSFLVFENALKAGISPGSELLGRVTGSGAVTTIGGVATGGIQLVSKFWFSPESKYNGSSITVMGTTEYPLPPWEFIVVGGTGNFRGYSGYALSSPEQPFTAVGPLFVFQWKFFLFKQF